MLCPNCFKNSMNNDICADCGYQLDFKDTKCNLKLFTKLKNRYLIGRSLGAGGFGITYIAYDLVTDSRVCVKEYFPMGIASRADDGSTVECIREAFRDEYRHGIDRFLEEAGIIGDLNNISGIVNISDSFECNSTAYYVMEHLDGVSLFSIVPPGGLELDFANDIILKAGRNLDIVHREKGYLHRDISPENIMILKSGRVVIIDFGSAKSFFLSSSNYTITLKHGFAPIEQYSNADSQGPFTDLYALAATYYFTLTYSIIPRATERIAGKEYEPLCKVRPDVPAEVSRAVDMALALYPEDRLRTVGDFLDLLEHGMKGRSGGKKHCITVTVDGVPVAHAFAEEDHTLVAGRSQKCDLVIDRCENISKRHCLITFDGVKQQFCIEDCSTNGTYINYVRMEKGTKYFVGKSDLIILANTRCSLILEDEYYAENQ